MFTHRVVVAFCCAVILAASGCSRQQSDWQKAREANTAEAYEQFLKKWPSGEFTAQAQALVKALYEERDWQKARDTDTAEAYQAFLKQYPEGSWSQEARIRVENFALAQAPAAAAPSGPTPPVAAGPAAAPPLPPQPSAVPSPPAPPAAATAPSSAGGYGVQLGAFKSGAAAAEKRWAHLQKQYPRVLSGLSSKVVPRQTAQGNLYRLQAIGMTEKHAREICNTLKANSEACIVVSPDHG